MFAMRLRVWCSTSNWTADRSPIAALILINECHRLPSQPRPTLPLQLAHLDFNLNEPRSVQPNVRFTIVTYPSHSRSSSPGPLCASTASRTMSTSGFRLRVIPMIRDSPFPLPLRVHGAAMRWTWWLQTGVLKRAGRREELISTMRIRCARNRASQWRQCSGHETYVNSSFQSMTCGSYRRNE